MAAEPTYEIVRRRTVRRSQRWGWRLTSSNDVVAVSGEGYANREHAETMVLFVISGGYKNAKRVA
jgi:uncharacterized protein YegP (UPF0339 family)